MSEPIFSPGLFSALLLPWLCGTIWAACLLGKTGRHNIPLLLGHGFFLGYFAITLIIRLWDAVGLELRFVPLLATLFLLGFIGFVYLYKYSGFVRGESPRERLSVLAKISVCVLLLLIAWRYLVLTQELLLRPLYGWDSWMNWAPKAIVWFHQGSLVEFVSPQTWLAEGTLSSYTLGNAQAWDYPISVPLFQLWVMLGAGTSDHPALYLPWILAPLCLGLIFYGHLRLAKVGIPLAVGTCYLLLSMPYLNVHSVLAGYADLWLGAVFAAAICTLYELRHKWDARYAALSLLLALFCMQLKVPGLFSGLIIVILLVRTVLHLSPRKELLLCGGSVIALLVVLTIGVTFDFPHLGQVILSWEEMRVGRAGSFKPQYHPVEPAFIESFFRMTNWHLLFYLACALALIGVLSGRWRRWPETELLAVMAALIFVVAVFMLSGYYTQALNFVALNRALLHAVPALVFLCCIQLSNMVGHSALQKTNSQ